MCIRIAVAAAMPFLVQSTMIVFLSNVLIGGADFVNVTLALTFATFGVIGGSLVGPWRHYAGVIYINHIGGVVLAAAIFFPSEQGGLWSMATLLATSFLFGGAATAIGDVFGAVTLSRFARFAPIIVSPPLFLLFLVRAIQGGAGGTTIAMLVLGGLFSPIIMCYWARDQR